MIPDPLILSLSKGAPDLIPGPLSIVAPDLIRGPASSASHPIPNRGPSVPTARSEAPAWSRMFRGFAFRLSDHGRDFALCLFAIPGAIITATALAMVLAPIWQGIPA